ncbi:MAG: DUF2274 domain-containing protein [Bradyrhizobium sp.]|uniref:DUF2274 domain-containing protein n=1 Tax=Bradyrhizobium sp. TaxID=376 RepID=UPI001D933372|nr:DUF2274 domain-containing protein [Bradyrhizobium sp.]MBV9560271.1 DUF2274 domain-containing protein [Bradyrhizobium sp.]
MPSHSGARRKPVKVAIELPAAVHRDLVAYADILSRESGRAISDPAKLIAPMITRFMATDRAFVRSRRANQPSAANRDHAGVPDSDRAHGSRKS